MLALRQSPFLKLGFCIFVGIHFADELGAFGIAIGLSMGILSCIILIVDSRFLGTAYEKLISVGVFIAFIGIGGLIFLCQQHSLSQELQKVNCQRIVTSGVLKSSPICYDQSCKAELSVFSISLNGRNVASIRGTLLLKGKDIQFSQARRLDTIHAEVFITDVRSSYPRYLQMLYRKGIYYSAFLKGNLYRKKRSKLIDSEHIRSELTDQLYRLIGDNQLAGLACATILGNKKGLDEAVKSAFSDSGASHILAISGLHIGIIFGVFSYLLHFLTKLPYGNVIKGILVISALWGYLWLIDVAPAAFRAVFMFSCVCIYSMLNFRFHLLNIVGFSAIVHMLLNPLVVFHLGFQLSYVAVMGIICSLHRIETFTARFPHLIRVGMMIVGISLVASLFTSPLVIYHFGQFPTYFLLTNICLSFLTTWIVSIGFFFVVFAYVPYLNEFLGYLLNKLLFMALWICQSVSALPGAIITKISLFEMGLLILIFQLIIVLSLGFILNKFYVKNRVEKN